MIIFQIADITDTVRFPVSTFRSPNYSSRSISNQNLCCNTLTRQNLFCIIPRSHSLYPIVWICFSFWFPVGAGVALDVRVGGIDGQVCWNSKRRLPFIVSRPRKTNSRFHFPFAEDKRKFAVSVFHLQRTNWSFPLVSFSVYIYIYWNGSKCIDIHIVIHI